MSLPRFNPVLEALAHQAIWGPPLTKQAIAPAPAAGGGEAGMMAGDPMAAAGGGMPAPAPAPAAGAGMMPAGADPAAMAQSLTMQAAAGGGGMMAGKPGGKKVEQQLTDAKLYAIDVKLTAIMNHMQIPMPPEATLGAPPDPMIGQQAGAELSAGSPVPSLSGAGGAGSAAPPPGAAPAPVPGAEPKMAAEWLHEIFTAVGGDGSATRDDPMRSREPSIAERIRANNALAAVLSRSA